MGRWIKLHCQLAHHDLWLMEPFTRGQAWVDLLMLAQTKPGWIMVRGISVDLDRGQVGYSELSLSARWKWSRNKVRLFIDSLRKRQMVDIKKDNKTTIISVLNFDTYQARPTADDTADDTAEGQQKDSRRTLTRIKEGKKGKNKKKDNIPHGEDRAVGDEAEFYLTKKKRKLTGKRLLTFQRFWDAFGYFKGKAEAADSWLDIPTLTESLVETILVAARREAMARPSLVANGKTPKWAQGWITARRWEDEQDDAHELTPEEQTARDIAEAKRLRAAQGGGK